MSIDFSNANRQPMQQLNGTQAQWDALPKPALAAGQVATTTDTARVYVGTAVGDYLVNDEPPSVLPPESISCRFSGSGRIQLTVSGAAGFVYQIDGGDPVFSSDTFIGISNLSFSSQLVVTPADNIVDISPPGATITSFLAGSGGQGYNLLSLDLRQTTNLSHLVVVNRDGVSLKEFLLPESLPLAHDHGHSHYFYSNSLHNAGLNAVQLNRFYNSLAPAVAGQGLIIVSGNPGAAESQHSIATDKGYTISGV